MSERREQLKRERRRRKLRERRIERAEAGPLDEVVGYFAAAGINALCDADACVIAESEATMRRLISERTGHGDASRYRIRQTTLGEIARGLRLGAAYAFEPAAFQRFRPLAERAGMPLGPERSQTPQCGAVHLVRVQFVGA